MTAISLHLGLNAVDPAHYAGWDGALAGCENDARDLAAIARSQGFDARVVLTRDARAEVVLGFLDRAASTLTRGDRVLVTFSGHGSQVDATDLGEIDRLDETWALYDRMIIDNEIRAALDRMAAGVGAVVVLDCCHSGTAFKAAFTARDAEPSVSRMVPPHVARAAVTAHRELYQRVAAAASHARARQSGAGAAILLAACQDDQLAADGLLNGRFTGALKQVWNRGGFVGDHRAFHREIVRLMPRDQIPNLEGLGPAVDELLTERPFASTGGSTNPRTESTMSAISNINGNWDEVAAALSQRASATRGDGDFLARVIATNAASAQAAFFGSAAPTAAPTTPTKAGSRGGTVARAFWWGFHIEISHEDLQVFLSSADPINAVIGAIGGGIPSPAAPFIAIAAAFVAGALGLLRSLDRGRGVYVSMSWFAPGIFIPTSV